MLFRQLFDTVSCSYTYLLASSVGSEALIIDPVLEKTNHYLKLLEQLNLKLVKAIDTHLHADHLTALGALRDQTSCVTVMGKQSSVNLVSMRVDDGDKIEIDGVSLDVMYTPGHTDDSYCFYRPGMVFTGDTLLIRGSGRTDFQNGNAEIAYESIFNKLLVLPEDTFVYPGHDYKGDTVSTIGEEKAFNPRLQVRSKQEYVSIMGSLGLASPKMMDVVVPANQEIGMSQNETEIAEHTMSVDLILGSLTNDNILFVDLREDAERQKNGVIPNSLHLPYIHFSDHTKFGDLLGNLSGKPDQKLLLYCAYGERSALALKELRSSGLKNSCHLAGGIDAWINAGGPILDVRKAP